MTEFLAIHSPELFTCFAILFACVLAFPFFSYVLKHWRGE